ncbi:MAG: oligosaccharide flippase family protein [Candidatus Tritonobacter lacicola]|nr:oligosaccharide flippase family protein [Candidatus Tritonobacter lacicola]
MKTLRDQVIRNSSVNVASFSWQALLSFFITPYIIWRIGNAAFGLWAVVYSIVTFCSLLDFDLAQAFVKYVAEYNASKEMKKLNQVVNTGLVLYLAFGAAVVAVVWVAAPAIIGIFPEVFVEKALYGDGLFVLKIAALIYAMETGLSALTCIPRGVQRLDIEKIVLTVKVTLDALGTVIVLELGHGIKGLVITYLITSALACFVKIILAFRLLPTLRLSPSFVSVATVKHLFPFCWRLEVMKFSQWSNLRLDKILIGYFISLEAVTLYHLGSVVVGFVRRVPTLFLAALMPAFSELSVSRSAREFHASVVRATKYIALVAVPMAFFLGCAAGKIMEGWMGPGYEASANVIRILVVGYCASIAAGGGLSSAVIGMGRPGVQMKASVLNAVLNTVLSVALILRLGFYGAPLGTTIAMVVAVVYFMARFQGLFSREDRTPFTGIYLKVVVAGGAACLVFPVIEALLGPLGVASRLTVLLRLSVDGACYVFLCLAMLMITGYFDERDRLMLSKFAPLTGWRKK